MAASGVLVVVGVARVEMATNSGGIDGAGTGVMGDGAAAAWG